MRKSDNIWLNARAVIEKVENGERMVLIQRRVTDGIAKHYEFPGGCVEANESIIDALKREVLEETGLAVTKIYGAESYMHNDDVEYVKPYSVYNMLKGWTNSSGERERAVGIHFKCEVDGVPLEIGDNSAEIHWVTPEKLRTLLDKPNMFGSSDRGAAETYLLDVSN